MAYIPEINIFNFTRNAIQFVKDDLKTAIEEGNEAKSWLYKYLNNENIDERFNYYTQAKDLFTRKESGEERAVAVRLFFDKDRVQAPTIHITVPSESEGSLYKIGGGLGVETPFTRTEGEGENLETFKTQKYSKSFNVKFGIIITSVSAIETLVLYHILKALIIVNLETLECFNIYDINFSASDFQLNEELVPEIIFSKALEINAMYDLEIPSIVENQFGGIIEKLLFCGKLN